MSFKTKVNKFADKNAVLVGIDFSADSKAALIWACRYAHRMKVPVVAFHAVHEPAEAPGFYQRDESNQLSPLKEIASTMMDDFLKTLHGRKPKVRGIGKVRTLLVKGLPAERILTAAEKMNASLLVMGSRGRTGLSNLVMGSIAEQVAKRSMIPVTIVKARGDDQGE